MTTNLHVRSPSSTVPTVPTGTPRRPSGSGAVRAKIGETDPHLRRYTDIRQLIASIENPTPLVRLNHVLDGDLELYLKLEWLNPFGSIKDRTALYLLEGLERSGRLDGRDLVEPSSGNTGIALAALAALRGTKLVVTIPDGVPEEKKLLLRMLGAEVMETPDDLCPVDHPKDGAIALARSIAASEGGNHYVMPNQYENPDNVRAHYETTGPEIWRQTEGRVRCFFAGFGTCGTLTGVGRFLKEQDPSIRIVAIEPQKGHRLPGLKNFQEAKIPSILDESLIDEVVRVDDAAAYQMTRRLFLEEGLVVGPSTGAIVCAAAKLGAGAPGMAVGVSPDGGLKYLSYFAEILGDPTARRDGSTASATEAPIFPTLDCTAMICPLPVYKAKAALDEMQVGETLRIVCSDPASLVDFPAFARRGGHELLERGDSANVQTFLLRKGSKGG